MAQRHAGAPRNRAGKYLYYGSSEITRIEQYNARGQLIGTDNMVRQPQQREIINTDGAGDFVRYMRLTYPLGETAMCYQMDNGGDALITAYHYQGNVLAQAVTLAILDGAMQTSVADFVYDARGGLSRIMATVGGKMGQVYPRICFQAA